MLSFVKLCLVGLVAVLTLMIALAGLGYIFRRMLSPSKKVGYWKDHLEIPGYGFDKHHSFAINLVVGVIVMCLIPVTIVLLTLIVEFLAKVGMLILM